MKKSIFSILISLLMVTSTFFGACGDLGGFFSSETKESLSSSMQEIDTSSSEEEEPEPEPEPELGLQFLNKILVVESEEGSSEELVSLLTAELDYEMTVVTTTGKEMPATIEDLLVYDQVIMNNIANADLPEGFDVILQSYVEDFGGGLFTVGGRNEDGDAHAYNKEDMYGTVYQSLLPVQADTYTPPVGVMFILDNSGSMSMQNDEGLTFFNSARQGIAWAISDNLSERDYVGLMTLETDPVLEMTPRTQEHKIKEAISNMEFTRGDTDFFEEINTAGKALRSLQNVAKRHVVIITDGVWRTIEECMLLIDDYYRTDGITFSVVGIDMDWNSRQMMETLTQCGGGRLQDVWGNTRDIIQSLTDDLTCPDLKEVNYSPFNPIIYNAIAPLLQGIDCEENRLTVTLNGFNGGKVKEGADLILVGEYEIPIYAQWKYGAGTVGSFMCDLQATDWSADFMADVNGQKLIQNIVKNLMPTSA